MGGYIALALAGIDLARRRIGNTQRMASVNKKLGTPWYKQIWEMPLTSDPLFGETYAKNRETHLADLQAKARNSTGVGGEAALKKAANATQQIMNQQLAQNISTINQDWGMAGRYSSGARIKAIEQAQNQNAFNLTNVVNSMALQESQFQRNLGEEHEWRQASLDAGQPSRAGQIGDIAATLASLYMQNPEEAKRIIGWGKEGVSREMLGPATGKPYTYPDNMPINSFDPLSEEIPQMAPSVDTGYIDNLLTPPAQTTPAAGPRKSLLSTLGIGYTKPAPLDYRSMVDQINKNPQGFLQSALDPIQYHDTVTPLLIEVATDTTVSTKDKQAFLLSITNDPSPENVANWLRRLYPMEGGQ